MFDQPLQLQQSCTNIRHKLMYCDARHQVPGYVDDSSDTRVFFCSKTGDVLGPDGEAVSPDDCEGGRECFCGAPT
jgi:hypothetical protein